MVEGETCTKFGRQGPGLGVQILSLFLTYTLLYSIHNRPTTRTARASCGPESHAHTSIGLAPTQLASHVLRSTVPACIAPARLTPAPHQHASPAHLTPARITVHSTPACLLVLHPSTPRISTPITPARLMSTRHASNQHTSEVCAGRTTTPDHQHASEQQARLRPACLALFLPRAVALHESTPLHQHTSHQDASHQHNSHQHASHKTAFYTAAEGTRQQHALTSTSPTSTPCIGARLA